MGKNWIRIGSNYNKIKEMEMDWLYFEEGERILLEWLWYGIFKVKGNRED